MKLIKIFSKILVNSLKPLLHKFIMKTQNGNPGMDLKLDISKACDQINWIFLYEDMGKIGFSQKIIRMVKLMVETIKYSVMANGLSWENFGEEMELRQGDLISPYLFIMVVEVLGRAFLRKMEGGVIKGIKLSSMLRPEVIHQFMDETFLSGESSMGEARAWKSMLEIYAVNAGQKINLDKSKVFFFNTPPNI